MKPDHLLYFETLETKFGSPSVIRPMESQQPDQPPVFCFIYHDTPEPGMITGVTYGLSLAEHPEWTDARRELVLSLHSTDETWPLAMAYFASAFRGEHNFSFSSVFSLDGPITDESAMSAFFLYAPSVLDADQCDIELGSVRIELVGLYPMYAGEVQLFKEIGVEAFMMTPGFDLYNVNRPDLSAMGDQ